MKAFEVALMKTKTFFDDVYGDKQVHLWILGTHPDYQRRGAGAKCCGWGISQAKKNTSALTLFSSPMGQKLYTSVGFKVVGNATEQVEGVEEKLSIGAMAYETVTSSWRCAVRQPSKNTHQFNSPQRFCGRDVPCQLACARHLALLRIICRPSGIA